MQITVEISEEFASRATSLGLTPEAYIRELVAQEESAQTVDAAWEAEAMRRAGEIDSGQTRLVAWEEIESRLRSRIAG